VNSVNIVGSTMHHFSIPSYKTRILMLWQWFSTLKASLLSLLKLTTCIDGSDLTEYNADPEQVMAPDLQQEIRLWIGRIALEHIP
jgi:hypothetical protein